MPIVAYTPQWEAIKAFISKLESHLPEEYTGLMGIRLHRTGYPLTIELFGAELPERDLYPMALVEMKDGEPAKGWDYVQNQYEVPWARPSDFHRYRVNVMENYHAEDLLEARAEQILNDPKADPELLRKAIVENVELAGRS
jgi:hypothetical protein